jgi:hypothetical protein
MSLDAGLISVLDACVAGMKKNTNVIGMNPVVGMVYTDCPFT